MIAPKTYLQELREIAYNSSKGWRITTISELDDEYDKIQFEATLKSLNDPSVLETYKKGGYDHFIQKNKELSFDELIARLAPALLQDIGDCTQAKHHEKLNKTSIGVMPLTGCNAFCTNKSYDNEILDGYAICINQGLYFCLALMSKALVLRNISGELEAYKRKGAAEYQSALRFYFQPNKEDLKAIFFDAKEVPPQAFGQLGAYQSSVSMMILQFVALHEFGHIVRNDLEKSDIASFHLSALVAEKNILNKDKIIPFWEAEYGADVFALKALCSRSKSASAAWANFLTIYLFFTWVADIEEINGKEICPFHPPPKERAHCLIMAMHEMYGITQEAQEMMDRIDSWSKEWINGAVI